MVQVTVQQKGGKPIVLSLDGTVHQVTVADVKRGVQKQVSKVSEVIAAAPSSIQDNIGIIASRLHGPIIDLPDS